MVRKRQQLAPFLNSKGGTMNALADRVAIITGASRGIGKGIAARLAQEGVRVVIAAKTTEPHPRLPGTIHETVEEIREAGGEALAVKCDVRRQEDRERVVNEALSVYGRIDILINNAGAMWFQPLAYTEEKRLDLLLDVNFKAPFLLSQLCIPHMAANGWGHIVNMSPPAEPQISNSGGMIAYLTSKLGATLLAHGLGDELKGTGIACNALWPRTLIESLATITFGLGSAEDWRRPDILVDAVLLILQQDPRAYSGQSLIDEEVLRDRGGVDDFSAYRAAPGSEPPAMDLARFKKKVEEAMQQLQGSA
jgi:NAD(P)-dependent dehydrogenase (short-subunit alcohol dehydrogenase family)